MTELAHANRNATAGELSSAIAHELNQPLGTILTNADTAEPMLNSASLDLSELKEIVADIRRDDLRASEVIHRMRSFLKRTPFETKDIDLNNTMREVFEFLSAQASARNPFFTTRKQGTGIGLPIARTIVQAHNGWIWAENQAGGGAVFGLSLPLSTH
jgi:signal transduction histidine kinase